MRRLLIAEASLVRHRLSGVTAWAVAGVQKFPFLVLEHRLHSVALRGSGSTARAISQDQESDPCLLYH